jgi:type IV pilus assembly protein PilO
LADVSLTKLPWQAQLAVFVVLSLAGAGAFYYFYEMPKRADLDARQRELTTIRLRIDKALATARQLNEFKKEVADLRARLDSLRPILPDARDAGELLRRMTGLAKEANLTVLGFKPHLPIQKAMHAEWPITLSLEGSYHNLGAFLDLVSRFPRIINVSSLVISAKEPARPNASVEVTCTATTFVLTEAAATAKPAQKKTE